MLEMNDDVTPNLDKLLRALEQQLGKVPEWRLLILMAREELQQIKQREVSRLWG